MTFTVSQRRTKNSTRIVWSDLDPSAAQSTPIGPRARTRAQK